MQVEHCSCKIRSFAAHLNVLFFCSSFLLVVDLLMAYGNSVCFLCAAVLYRVLASDGGNFISF